jgi:hypothetical protein
MNRPKRRWSHAPQPACRSNHAAIREAGKLRHGVFDLAGAAKSFGNALKSTAKKQSPTGPMLLLTGGISPKVILRKFHHELSSARSITRPRRPVFDQDPHQLEEERSCNRCLG